MLDASTRNMCENTEWKVPMLSRAAVASPTKRPTRCCISRAALLVNVRARIFHGFIPCLSKYAIL